MVIESLIIGLFFLYFVCDFNSICFSCQYEYLFFSVILKNLFVIPYRMTARQASITITSYALFLRLLLSDLWHTNMARLWELYLGKRISDA